MPGTVSRFDFPAGLAVGGTVVLLIVFTVGFAVTLVDAKVLDTVKIVIHIDQTRHHIISKRMALNSF